MQSMLEPHQHPKQHVREGRVLIIDDKLVNRRMIVHMLAPVTQAVSEVDNGVDGLELLATGAYDLLILDIEMPGMDGFAVLQRMMSQPHLRNIPVIVTSSHQGIDRLVRCIELGAEDYLTRPINPVVLHARVRASLEKKRLRDEMRQLVRRFAIADVADAIEQSGFALQGSLVQASVLFCDIRGFTTMVTEQTPQETIALLNTYYAMMFEAIHRYNGVANSLMGDGVMAIFGAPVPYENHAERAVRAALDMQKAIRAYNVQRLSLHMPNLAIGIGISSGEMVAGFVGTNERASYTCVGHEVNMAARLEGLTKNLNYGILINSGTLEKLPKDIEVKFQGEVKFSGIASGIQVFAVIDAPTQSTISS